MAYRSILPRLSDKQLEVFEAIQDIQPCSNKDIKKYLGWEINSVTPRVKELREIGVIRQLGVKEEDSGRIAMTWGC
jgi:predicted transcriptional regulator